MRHGMNPRFPRHPWIWIWWRGVIVAGAAVALLAGLYSCDKGTGPKPAPKYLLYAAMSAPLYQSTGFVAVIDCETDSVVDSVKNVSSGPGVVVSPDGKYFAAISGGSPPQIFDAASRTIIKSLTFQGLPLFLPDASIVLCAGGSDSSVVYTIPEFAVKGTWLGPHGVIERVPGQHQVACLEIRGTGNGDRSKLMIFDYLSYRAVDSVVIDPDPQGVGFQIVRFTFAPDGTKLYATGAESGLGAGVVGYDLRSRRTLFRQTLYGPFGYSRVSPDGRELWVSVPGFNEDSPTWPQVIFIFNALTGTLVDSVSIRGISPNPNAPLSAKDIRFVPDGSKAYVNCGTPFNSRQPLLAVNSRTRHVDRLIFAEFKDAALMIDMAPRP